MIDSILHAPLSLSPSLSLFLPVPTEPSLSLRKEERRTLSHLLPPPLPPPVVTLPPRIFNDAILSYNSSNKAKAPTMEDYIPPTYVANMHDAPRFGHTNRIGTLASSNPSDVLDYSSGLKQFTLFVIVPFLIWGIILVLFKYIYGIHRIGCAAGGEVIDLKQLSKEGVSRKTRKKRILRSWRLQTAFIITGTFIPIISLIMMREGWAKVELAWQEVNSVVDEVETLAYRGWNALDNLQTAKTNLYANHLVQDVLQKKTKQVAPIFASWCPKAAEGGADNLAFLKDALSMVENNTETLVTLFDDYVPKNSNGFIAMTHATASVEASIEWFFSHDWIWKMYIMVLNVFSFFLILCCYIVSKHNIIHWPTRYYLTFLIVPLFSIFTILLIMVTASSGVATLMNADFCAGGEQGFESPEGTIRDAIFSYQLGTVNPLPNNQTLTGAMNLVYESFTYYANGCLTENPLAFLDDYAGRVEQAVSYIVELSDNLPDNPETGAMLNLECGSDVSFLPKGLKELKKELLTVQSNINSIVDLSQCFNISPLLRRLTYGSICKDSAEGLTWIWACSLVICICCFVMLTTRAALYNSVKSRKKRDKKPKRVVEKEFEEYKKFMGEYYEDAAEWKLHWKPPKDEKKKKKKAAILDIDFEESQQYGYSQVKNSLENGNTSTLFPLNDFDHIDDDEFNIILDISQAEGILSVSEEEILFYDDDDSIKKVQESKPIMPVDTSQDQEDLNSDDSMHDSDYESDSDDSESGEDNGDESAMLSFFVETKSILSETISVLSDAKSIATIVARRTVQRIRNLRPLLVEPKDDDEDYLLDREGISFEENSLFLHSPPRNVGSGEVLWNFHTPPSQKSISSTKGVKTPMAPQKPFYFFGRIRNAEDHELVQFITMTPSNDEDEIPSKTSGVHPRRLKMSPFMAAINCSPDEKKPQAAKAIRSMGQPSKTSEWFDVGDVSKSKRVLAALTTKQPQSHHPRPRLGSDGSEDISLYVEDGPTPSPPKAPQKSIRRLPRTPWDQTSDDGDRSHR